jgi:hypothetical protein
MSYVDTFIVVADDCPVNRSLVPKERGGKKTVAVIQYEMLAGHPYEYTQEDVLFHTRVRRDGIPDAQLKAHGKGLRDEFFAKDQPCLRCSPLARTHGWGFHFDARGRVALYPVESEEYRRLAKQAKRVVMAMRRTRG